MNRIILGLAGWFRWPLRLAGVDDDQFRAILEVKLILDSKRQTAAAGFDRKRKKPRNTFLLTLVAYSFFGLFVSILIAVAGSALVSLTIMHSYVIVMVALTLITDFSSVLLESKDHEILGARPVTPRTLFIARLAHVLIFLSAITLSLTIFAFAIGTVRFGLLFPPVFALGLIAGNTVSIGVVAVLYLLIMRFLNEERLRDAILYVQIAMTLVFVGGYQIMPRLMDMTQLKTLDISDDRWIWFYPPTWFAAPVDILAGNGDATRWILTAMGAVLAVVILVVVVLSADSFRRSHGEKSRRAPGAASRTRVSSTLRLARLVARPGAERAAFDWTWQLCARSRNFKRRTYPLVAVVFVFAAVMVFVGADSYSDAVGKLATSNQHLVVLYFMAMLLPASAAEMRFSEQFEAAWIYHIVPVGGPGVLLSGSLKAVLIRFVTPALVLVAVPIVVLGGLRTVPDVLLAGSVTVMFSFFHGLVLGNRELPFSIPIELHNQQGRLIKMMLLMMVGLVLGLVHWVLTLLPGAVLAAIPLVWLTAWMLLKQYQRQSWGTIPVSG